jgi:hypothetical protein
MDRNAVYAVIREELAAAAHREAGRAAFNLRGRGHEERVSLSPPVANMLRGSSLPRVTISGYGANNFYPLRVFTDAQKPLQERLGWVPLAVVYRVVYLNDIPSDVKGQFQI